MRYFFSIFLISILFVSGCDDDGNTKDCIYSNSIVNENGSLHGEPCDKDEDCKYGICRAIPSTSLEYKVCTKICNCGENSTCSDDDDPSTGRFYFCFRPNIELYGKEYYCIPSCKGKNIDFCQSNFADFYNKCGNDLNDGKGSVGVAPGCLYVK